MLTLKEETALLSVLDWLFNNPSKDNSCTNFIQAKNSTHPRKLTLEFHFAGSVNLEGFTFSWLLGVVPHARQIASHHRNAILQSSLL